ncbi:DoxX family protein [Nocardioides sp. R1-1]|uniref:DoxX family protein n=1 Tax=Nocardioides sp. R1-1 TaxID=3383502 RepID=UPI0038CF4A6C
MILSLILALALACAFAGLGAAKVAKAPSMLARADHLGFSAQSYQLIGTAELAGAVGLLAGLAYLPVGLAAGIGLLALLGGAVATHLRRGDGPADLAPAVAFAALAVAYLVVLATTG